jgi:HEAT repeat protein
LFERAKQIVLAATRALERMEDSDPSFEAGETQVHFEFAVETLVLLGETIVPELKQRLRSDDFRVRAGAAYVLSKLGPKASVAVPNLLHALKDEHWLVRTVSTNALARFGSDLPAVRQALKRMRDDENEFVRQAASYALSQIERDRERGEEE